MLIMMVMVMMTFGVVEAHEEVHECEIVTVMVLITVIMFDRNGYGVRAALHSGS
jgi:hypothetical protein